MNRYRKLTEIEDTGTGTTGSSLPIPFGGAAGREHCATPTMGMLFLTACVSIYERRNA
jgi:hypothetical protein